MNVQKDQIQALIAEIDEVLNQPSLRLPWVVFGETVTRSRQVLERVRNYLITLEQEADESVGITPMEPNQPLSGSLREPLWQAIRREMVYLRTQLTQPLQDEVDRLRQEHRSLMQEIQQLEARKTQTLVSLQPQPYQQQLSREFLQELMARLEDTLIQNVTETLSHIETRFLDSILLPEANPTAVLPALSEGQNGTGASSSQLSTRLTPAQRLEQMRQLQAQSDHLLMTLDSSLSVIFEALQRNLQTYSDSLGQSIERMHSLGQQGEVMFTSWMNQVAQHVGEETSSYLQSSLQLTATEEASSPPPTLAETPLELETVQTEELLPYAGMEFPRQTDQQERSPSTALEPLETRKTQIEQRNLTQPEQTAEINSRLDLEDPSLPTGEELAFSLDLEASFSEPETESAISQQLQEHPNSTEADSFESENLNETVSELDLLFGAEPEETTLPNLSSTQPSDLNLSDENEEEEVVTMLVSDDEQTEEESTSEEEIPTLWNEPSDEEVANDKEEQSWEIGDLFEQSVAETDNFDRQRKEVALNALDQDFFSEDVNPTVASEPEFTEPDTEDQDFFSEDVNPAVASEPEFTEPDRTDIALAALEQDLFLEGTNPPTVPDRISEPQAKSMTQPQVAERHPFEETLADFSDIFEELTLVEADPNAGLISARTQQELTQSFTPTPEPIQSRQELFVEDDYIPASQEENLLPTEEEVDSDQIDTHLMIDRNTIEQLETDLFNLEQLEPNVSSSSSKRKPSPPKPERAAVTAVAQPRTPIAAKSVPSTPEEVITFDDLFKELGMGGGSAKASSAVESVTDHDLEAKTFSDLTLDDVFESFDLGMEVPIEFQSDTEDPLSLESLGDEIWNPSATPLRATTKRIKS